MAKACRCIVLPAKGTEKRHLVPTNYKSPLSLLPFALSVASGDKTVSPQGSSYDHERTPASST